MTTIQDFPSEIIAKVFSLVEGKKRTPTLVNAALVCDVWTTLAQDELWSRIKFASSMAPNINKFLKMADTPHKKRIVELSLARFDYIQQHRELVREIVACCQGVKRLRLQGIFREGRIELELLQSDSLSGMLPFPHCEP